MNELQNCLLIHVVLKTIKAVPGAWSQKCAGLFSPKWKLKLNFKYIFMH